MSTTLRFKVLAWWTRHGHNRSLELKGLRLDRYEVFRLTINFAPVPNPVLPMNKISMNEYIELEVDSPSLRRTKEKDLTHYHVHELKITSLRFLDAVDIISFL